ncbi:MAG: DUF4339 domain-containing protein [Kiritimatiellia bacterium]
MNPEERIWHITVPQTGGTQGPYTGAEILQWISDGRIGGGNYLWREGWENWKPLAEVDELAEKLPVHPRGRLHLSRRPAASPEVTSPAPAAAVSGGGSTADAAAAPDGFKTRAPSVSASEKEFNPEKDVDPSESAIFLFLKAFAYPFNPKGIWMLVLGGIFFTLLKMLQIGLIGFFIGLFATAFFISYMFKVVRASAEGKKEMPEWPNVLGYGADIWWPLPAMLAIILIAFGPGIACFLAAPFVTGFGAPLLVIGAVSMVAGGLYFPMAFLAAAMGTRLYLKPHVITASIFRVFGTYVFAPAVLGIVGAVNAIEYFTTVELFHPLVVYVIDIFASFYFAIVESRILGLLYFKRSERLGWDLEGIL